MDPETLRELMGLVQQARSEGFSEREINRRLRRNRNIPVNSVNVLRTEAQAAGLLTPQGNLRGSQAADDEGDTFGENVRETLASIASGAGGSAGLGKAGSFTQDLIRFLENTPIAREGASERFRQDVEEAREEQPFVAIPAEAGSLLLGPLGQAGVRGGTAFANLLGRGGAEVGQAAARGAGLRSFGQLVGREFGRGVGTAVGGAGAGAAEGGVTGFAQASGQPMEERLDNAALNALWGGGGGLLLGGIGAAISSPRRIAAQSAQRGEVLGEAAEQVAENLPTRRGVSSRVEMANQNRRVAFEAAEAQGKEIPGEVTDILVGNQQARNAIQNAAQKGSPEARRFLRELRRFEAGERASIPQASFKLADDVRRQLKFQGETFERQTSLLGADATPPSQGAVEEAGRVHDILETTLRENVPGFRQALEESAQAGTQARAYQTGRQLFNEPADVVEDVVQRGKKVQRGEQAVQIADDPLAKEAARAGMAENVLTQLRGGRSGAERFINRLEDSSELRRKMRVILGDDEAVETFLEEAQRLQAVGQLGDLQELFVKMAGFLGGGTSIAGGIGGVLLGFD